MALSLTFDGTVAHWPQLANWFSRRADSGAIVTLIRLNRGFDF